LVKEKEMGISIAGILTSVLGSVASSVIGGLFGGKDEPKTTPAVVPEVEDKRPEIQTAKDRSRRRQTAAVGRQGNIRTSALGLTESATGISRPSVLGA
jgi:hypothetical protein